MIAEECKKLREQLEEVKKANDRRNIVEQLDMRRDELVALREAVLAVTDSLKAIALRTSIEGKLDPAKAIARVRKIRETLKNDPLSITEGHDFSNMKKAFQKFAAVGTECVQATWAQYMLRARPSVDTNQLAQAEQQKDFKQIAADLKNLVDNAEQLAETPPANEEVFAKIESAWKRIREMIAALPDVADDPVVQEFLKEANSFGGASIDLLTDEVRAWLQENGIAGKYRITTM